MRRRGESLAEDADSLTVYSTEQYTQLTERIRTKDRAQERLDLAENEIMRLCDRFEVGDAVEDEAIRVYRQMIQTDLVNNFRIGDLTAAAVYAACRKHRVPQTILDVATAAKVLVDSNRESTSEGTPNGAKTQWVTRSRVIESLYRKIRDRFDRRHFPVEPKKFARRYCDELNLDAHVVEFVQVAIERVDETTVAGKESSIVATGAIYYASETFDLDLTLYDLENVTGRNRGTISETRTLIKENIEP